MKRGKLVNALSPFTSFIFLFQRLLDVFSFHCLPSGMLGEANGFSGYSGAFSLEQLHEFLTGVFAYSICSSFSDQPGYRCYWQFSHFYHYERVMGGYI